MSPDDRVRRSRPLSTPARDRPRVAAHVPLRALLTSGASILAASIPCRAAALQQATGEQFVHESWTVEDGLPVNSINAIVQSRDGYLWLATWDGLVRFDGVRFTVFNTGNSAGLPSSRIVNLIGTKDGSLWLRTEQNHLVRFQNGAFTLYESDRGVEPNTARLLYQDRQNVLWLGTDRGVYRLEGDRFVPVAATAIRQHVTALLRDVRGSLWAGTATHGLYRVAGDTIQHFASTDGVGADVIHALFEDASGTIWVGTERGVATYRGGRFTELRSSGGTLRAAVTQFYPSTRAGDVWIGTDSGVYSYAGGAMRRRVRGPGFS
ncbi:MAG: ligand-binding sensor domain-containing protein, partial [Acidimicrobiales bacterium]